MPDLPDYYTQTLIAEAEAARFKGGLDANKPDDPVSKDLYLATDTKILYVCVVNGTWTGFDASILVQGILKLYENMDANSKKITNLAAPTNPNDAVRKAYADLFTLLATFNNHKARHQTGGADELSIAGLAGLLADDQHVIDAEVLLVAAALVHAARHQTGGADEVSIAGLLGESAELATHKAVKAAAAILGHVIVEAGSDIDVDALGKLTLGGHKARHQDTGDDEISVAGLAGLLADDQHVLDAEVLAVAAALVHAARHQTGGADEISVAGLAGVLTEDQHIIDAEAVAAVEAAGLILAALKKIVFANDGLAQFGVLDGSPTVFGGVAADPQELFIQPKDGNTFVELGLVPKGTQDIAILSLRNASDLANFGSFKIFVDGLNAIIQATSAGTGTAPNKLFIKLNTVPFTSVAYGLGDATYWWKYINALNYHLLSGVGATHPVSGTIVDDITAGETLALGDAVYFKSDGKAWKSDADGTATMPVMALAAEAIEADAAGKFLLSGFLYLAAWEWTIGGIIYGSCTTGALTQTAPSETGDQVQVVGIGITADIIHFNPSFELVEIS